MILSKDGVILSSVFLRIFSVKGKLENINIGGAGINTNNIFKKGLQ